MTLNITVASKKRIFQSADYRLRDFRSRDLRDFLTQKSFVFHTKTWRACIAFCGVGMTSTIDVSAWVAEKVRDAQERDLSLDEFVEGLCLADEWLKPLSPRDRLHSFSIGAFVGQTPVVALVSNYQSLNGPDFEAARPRLEVFRENVDRAFAFVSGPRGAVPRNDLWMLKRLAGSVQEVSDVFDAFHRTNRQASDNFRAISPSCFVSHIDWIGRGSGKAYEVSVSIPRSPAPLWGGMDGVLNELSEKQFGKGNSRLVQVVFAHGQPTDEYHRAQLADDPNDPSRHSNYGAFLADVKKDDVRAEIAYRSALQLDADHLLALTNLAGLRQRNGDAMEAERLYRRAHAKSAGADALTTIRVARFLFSREAPAAEILLIIESGIAIHSENAELVLLKAGALAQMKRFPEALVEFDRARLLRAPQAEVEANYAITLHMSGAPTQDCIGAYRTALAVFPNEKQLQLNLSQLLLLEGQQAEGLRLLHSALRQGLSGSAKLEALIYQLCYTNTESSVLLDHIERELVSGHRIEWNMKPTIEHVYQFDPNRGQIAEDFVLAATGKLSVSAVRTKYRW